MATDDGTVSSQGGTFFYKGRAHLIHLANFCAGVEDVREDHRGAAEDAIFQGDAFIDGDVVLDFAFVADDCVGADKSQVS